MGSTNEMGGLQRERAWRVYPPEQDAINQQLMLDIQITHRARMARMDFVYGRQAPYSRSPHADERTSLGNTWT